MVLWTAAIASLALAMVAVEFYLRATRSVQSLFGDLQEYPEIASEGWARAFVHEYEEIVGRGALAHGLTGDRSDPLLGWDTPGHVRGRTPSESKPHGTRRIVAIGDSFTFGDQVETDETFSARLEEMLPGTEVLNLGVRAYCVGQMLLKLSAIGTRYDPDVVIFAVYGPDYLRTSLGFYRFAKPRFEIGPDRKDVAVRDTPIASREETYERLRAEQWPLSWTFAFFRQELMRSRMWRSWSTHDRVYREESDALHEMLLREARDVARRSGAEILFVYVPDASEFETPLRVSWDRASFRRLFAGMGAPRVDLVPALLARHSPEEIRRRFYVWTGDQAGHFSREGNAAVARILANRISGLPELRPSPAVGLQTFAPSAQN